MKLNRTQPHPINDMGTRFRIATYNIHKCRGLDRRVRPAPILEVLREIDPDVIALQEVLNVEKDPEWDPARFIATELGFHSCFGENRRLYGVATATCCSAVSPYAPLTTTT